MLSFDVQQQNLTRVMIKGYLMYMETKRSHVLFGSSIMKRLYELSVNCKQTLQNHTTMTLKQLKKRNC